MTTSKQNWLLVGLVIIGGIALWLMYAPNQGAMWESYITAAQQAYQQAEYAEAEMQLEAALKEAEAFGPDDVRLAASLNNLALLYEARARDAEAEPFYKRSLAIDEKALGPEHPDVATSLNNLALIYDAQGRYGEAEPLYKRALAIWEKALGPEHPDVAKSLANHAALLRETDRDAEAEMLEARAKAIRAKHAKENP